MDASDVGIGFECRAPDFEILRLEMNLLRAGQRRDRFRQGDSAEHGSRGLHAIVQTRHHPCKAAAHRYSKNAHAQLATPLRGNGAGAQNGQQVQSSTSHTLYGSAETSIWNRLTTAIKTNNGAKIQGLAVIEGRF